MIGFQPDRIDGSLFHQVVNDENLYKNILKETDIIYNKYFKDVETMAHMFIERWL